MSWEFDFFPHQYLRSELEQLESVIRKKGQHSRERMRKEKERFEGLEADLARVALLARSLAELCLDKGVLTKEELHARMLAVDMADGVGDKGLDPDVVLPGEAKLANLRPITPPTPPRRRRR